MEMSNRDKYSTNTRRISGISVKSTEGKIKSDDSHVKVAVRCRPMSKKELSDGHQSIVEFEDRNRIIIHDTSESPSDQLGTRSGERSNYSHVYDFDAVFDCNSTQQDVYDQVCRPIVDSILQGYNGTIFAYGQTGTGKTHTMEGESHRSNRPKERSSATPKTTQSRGRKSSTKRGSISSARQMNENDQDKGSIGIIPRAFKHIFNHVTKKSEVQFLIRASYLEIYQEEIHDLLRKDREVKLELRERPDIGVYVEDLTSFVCNSIADIEKVMRAGNQNRMVGATDMNEHSSRSHAIFMITVEQQLTSNGTKEAIGSEVNRNGRPIRVGKLNLVDLAGSERQRKTNSFGQRQRESIKINLSLSALGNVINSLMKIHTKQQSNIISGESSSSETNAGFVPYRDSKLTRLLQDSLGGNAKTLMIANIGPANYNYEETISTMNYASRTKCIKNRPKLNENPKDAQLRELQQEIADLRSKLANMIKTKDSGQISKSGESGTESDRGNALDRANVEKELFDLKKKLSNLESKLLNGVKHDGNALDSDMIQGYTNEQEIELEKKRAELAIQADREKVIRDELERREEVEMMAVESFSSIQQEVDAKKRLIRQILLKIKSMRDEIDSTQSAFSLELDELDQLQFVLQKELKLKCLIMDNFIPNSHVDQLLPRIVYDEKRNSCTVKPLDLPLEVCRLNDDSIKYSDYWKPTDDCIRPKSEFERICETIYPSNIRYKYENLIEPTLHVPSYKIKQLGRDTRNHLDNQLPITTRMQELLNTALNQREPDIVI